MEDSDDDIDIAPRYNTDHLGHLDSDDDFVDIAPRYFTDYFDDDRPYVQDWNKSMYAVAEHRRWKRTNEPPVFFKNEPFKLKRQ